MENLFKMETADLPTLVAALSLADRVVCPDGGAMHIAAALGKPIVALWADSPVERWRPWQVPHRIVRPPSRNLADLPLAAVLVYVLLWRTTLGFRLRAVGLSREASRYSGMSVKGTITLALTLSGAMAGLAGAVLVFGSLSHRMVTDGSATGFTGSAGFNGIVAALFGALNPLWTIVSAFIFGGLLVGGTAMQIAVQVPSSLIVALNGLVVVFVVSIEIVRRRYRLRLEPALGAGDVGPGPPPAIEGTEGLPGSAEMVEG